MSLHSLKALSVISHVAKVQTGEARNVALCVMDVMLTYPANRVDALEDASTLSCLFTILFEQEFKNFALQHIQKMMTVKLDDAFIFDMLFSDYTGAFLRILSQPSESNYHLMMEMLHSLQVALQQSGRQILQRQYRPRLDRLVHLLNFNHEDLSRHDLCVQVLRTLTMLLSGNQGSKRVMKQLGYNALRELILMCEKGDPSSEIIDELLHLVIFIHLILIF
jgi:hypothetical protein